MPMFQVRIAVQFKGRGLQNTKRAEEIFGQIMKQLGAIVQVERNPTLDMKQMSMILSPKKKANKLGK